MGVLTLIAIGSRDTRDMSPDTDSFLYFAPVRVHIKRSILGRLTGPLRLLTRRARFRHLSKIENGDRGATSACAIPHVHRKQKEISHDQGNGEVVQQPKGLRLHSAGRWR